MQDMFVTLDTSQSPIGAQKAVAPLSIPDMFVTLDTSQQPIPAPVKAAAP